MSRVNNISARGTGLPARLLGRAKRLWRRESGSATVEFVILFPMFIVIFLSAFESGMLMVRQVMLDRALDMTVRGLRLGTLSPPSQAELKANICSRAAIIPDCMNSLLVELRPVDKITWQTPNPAATCVDRTGTINPVVTVQGGGDNEMMIVRVCAVFDPFFPTSGLGLQLAKDASGAYALVSTSAFVNEPS